MFHIEWRGEVVVDILARLAIAFAWIVLALAVTISLNQVRVCVARL